MRVIINDLLYDTDKAKMLAEGLYSFEIGQTYVLPYKTPKGRYFIARTCVTAEGFEPDCLIPSIETQVKDLISKTSVDLYIKIFSEPEEA